MTTQRKDRNDMASGCVIWGGLMFAAWIAGMAIEAVLGIKENHSFLYWVAIPLLPVAFIISQRLERRWAAEKAEADRQSSAEHRRKLELARKYYKENPERLVWDVCSACNMRIPAFASRCPHCREDLRQDD